MTTSLKNAAHKNATADWGKPSYVGSPETTKEKDGRIIPKWLVGLSGNSHEVKQALLLTDS